MKEHRFETRVETSLTARWEGSATNQNSLISDLSCSGCYVDTICEVIVGETLRLQLLMPDGEWFELQGVVVRHSPLLGFAVSFTNLNEKQAQQIGSFLNLQIATPDESSEKSLSREPHTPPEQIDSESCIIM